MYNTLDLDHACSEIGGNFHLEHEGVGVCKIGDDELILYEPSNNVEVHHGSITTWEGDLSGLTFKGTHLELEPAEGNPGPYHGPMYVGDAKVTFDETGVRAQQTREW